MGTKRKVGEEEITIDLLQLFKELWKKLWLIILCGLIAGGAAFAYSAYYLDPQYSSSVMLYVNGSTVSVGGVGFNISSSSLTTARNLVDTYNVILQNRTTYERVIEKTGLGYYTWEQISKMTTATSVNNTEVMRVTVKSGSPYDSSTLANGIAVVLQERIAEIIDGASMEIVDSAIPITKKVAPSITKYTAIGLFLGVALACFIVFIAMISNDVIQEEATLSDSFDYPILATIPQIKERSSRRAGKHSGYGGYYSDHGNSAKGSSGVQNEERGRDKL